MTTYTAPAWFRPSAFEATLVPNIRAFSSAYGGSSQALDLIGERWRYVVGLPPCSRDDAAQREALFAKLRGGAHRLRLPHYGRMAPRGTLRGSPTLAATAAQGAASLTLAACTGVNLLRYPGFDVDGGGSGVAVGWTSYVSGSPTGVTRDQAAVTGGYVQRVFATSLGPSDRVGVLDSAPVAVVPGNAYTVSADVATGSGGVELVVYVDWTNGASVISSSQTSVRPVDGNYRRISFQANAPAGAIDARLYVWMTGGSGAAASAFFDNAQVAIGTQSEFAATTLKAGDLLGLSDGQLVMVSDDATAADDGTMTVSLSNRLRAAVSSGSALTWNQPMAEFMVMEPGGVPVRHEVGQSTGIQIEFQEVW